MYIKIIYILIILLIYTFPISAKKYTDFNINGAVLSHIHHKGSGYGSEKSLAMQKHLKNIGYNSVQINTFCYMRSREMPAVFYGFDSTMANKYLKNEIKNLKNKGFSVMLKPHLWIGGLEFNPDNWRNNIDYSNPGERASWFHNYGKFIINQARIAENNNVDIFVIGTELVKLTKYDEEWKKIIKDVRKVYNGKLTYAAEGRNAFNIDFWEELDFIGIDVYFPLTDKKEPSLSDLLDGWIKHVNDIKKLSDKYDKKIIFTEVGYKSVVGTAARPWEWNTEGQVSQQQQAQAFEALFRTFSNQDYIEGVYIWKYFTDNNNYEKGNIKLGFTPYGKIAEGVISGWIK
jgi:hypothetical protein